VAVQPIGKTQKLPALVPGVKLNLWRRDDEHSMDHDREYALVRQAVLERDRYTCQWCGFSTVGDSKADPKSYRASGYLEVHHIDDNHSNNDRKNLATICPFCHAVFHIGHTGHNRKAKIIYMPWMRQEDLNLLVNCLAVATVRNEAKTFEDAQEMFVWLQAYEGPAIEKFGEAVSDPALLASALVGLLKKNPKAYRLRRRALRDLRVLVYPEKYLSAVTWWAQHSFAPGKKWEDTWESMYAQWKSAHKKAKKEEKKKKNGS